MTAGLLRLIALAGIAVLGFGVVAAVGAGLADRWVAARLRSFSAIARARLLLAWAMLPAGIVTTLLALTLWPSLGVALGLAVDHCPAHVGHVHLCLHHLPARGPAAAGAVALGLVCVAGAAALFGAIRAMVVAKRLARLRSFDVAPEVGAVESPHALAVTVGWFRPRVLVSTALVARLTPDQLGVVVAHERAHAARRDALALTAARVITLLHLPAVRRRILVDLALASEQACDEIAAAACGDRVLVAETIVAAERAAATMPLPAVALGIGGSDVAERVESLLSAPPDDAHRRRALAALLAVIAVAVAMLAPHVHHWTESLLDLLPH